jgi:hypothetical protein
MELVSPRSVEGGSLGADVISDAAGDTPRPELGN